MILGWSGMIRGRSRMVRVLDHPTNADFVDLSEATLAGYLRDPNFLYHPQGGRHRRIGDH